MNRNQQKAMFAKQKGKKPITNVTIPVNFRLQFEELENKRNTKNDIVTIKK